METVAGHVPRRLDPRTLFVGAVILGALIFIAASALGSLGIQSVDTATGRTFPCTVLGVTDGDGPIMCAEQNLDGQQVQVRIRGIEARDEDNVCRIASGCTEMSWEEGRAVLRDIARDRITCESYGLSYDRVDAFCLTPDGVDVSCELIRMGAAVRWPEFDPEGRLRGCIPGRRR